MAQFILPFLADMPTMYLKISRSGTMPFPEAGPSTARICNAAIKEWRKDQAATICLAAGVRPSDGVSGRLVMRKYIWKQRYTRYIRLEDAVAKAPSFTTDGEVRAFVAHVIRARHARVRPEHDEVTVIARWWHIPRVKATLRKRLKHHALQNAVSIKSVSVPGGTLYDIIREIPAWVKNFLLGNL